MIKLSETFKTANRALLLHKGRTILTMLGVIIGVFAVVSLVSMGIGVQNYISDQFEAIGSNVVFVVPGKVDFSDDPAKSFGDIRLDQKHVDMLEKNATQYVESVSTNIAFGDSISYKTKNYYGTVYGVDPVIKDIYAIELDSGRFFSKNEANNKANVAVISPILVEELFKNVNPVGKKIKISDNVYEIVGTTKEKGQDFDEVVYIPDEKLIEDFNLDNITSIAIQAKSTDDIELAMKEVEFILLSDLDADDFSVIATSDILSSIQNVLGIMTAAVGAIAGISLLVGGIGIMNIMLVSVTERIKEIGLRKAVGAAPRDIAIQFMLEAILISVGGGMIGLLFGWFASLAARTFVRTEVPIWAVLLAFGFSVVVGVLFGTYPAIKASKKDPIEALRYE